MDFLMVLMGLAMLAGFFAVNWFVAKEMYSFAVDKGYKDEKYFWWCFWLGVIGYAMIIAMPDRGGAKSSAGSNELPDL